MKKTNAAPSASVNVLDGDVINRVLVAAACDHHQNCYCEDYYFFHFELVLAQKYKINQQPKPSPELRIHSLKRKLISRANPASETGLLGVGLQLGTFGIGVHHLVHKVIAQEIDIQCVALVQPDIYAERAS